MAKKVKAELKLTLQAGKATPAPPVVVNTSFNVRGEPIVQSPQDALHCFLHTDMDALMMGNLLVRKEHVPPERLPSRDAYLRTFQLD
jgi:carbamoyltransferase